MQLMGTKHYLIQVFSDGMDDFVMDEKTLETTISEFSWEDHVGDFFFRLARRNTQRICSGGWNYQCSVLQRCNGKAPKQNWTCWTGHVWIWWLVPFARQRPIPQCNNHQAVFGPTKVTVLVQPLYSPDLAPADYFLFPKVKSHLQGQFFEPFSDI